MWQKPINQKAKELAIQIAVIGNADKNHISKAIKQIAFEVSREIGKTGTVLVCGGMGGATEATAREAKESNGVTIGEYLIPIEKQQISSATSLLEAE